MNLFDCFYEKATKLYGDFYDYSKAEYKNARTKICIIDPEYGEFWQTPYRHLIGRCHPRRSRTKISKISLSWLLSIDPDQKFVTPYIEPTLVINNKKRKVDAYNPKTNTVYEFHGSYWHGFNGRKITDKEKYNNTLKSDNAIRGNGYNLVTMWEHDWNPSKEDWSRVPLKQTDTELFIQKARGVHKDFYSYEKTKYITNNKKVCIIDPEYGEFWQVPTSHLNGNGNPKRARVNSKYNTEEFIQQAIKVHGDTYNYDKVEYKNSYTKVLIIDPLYGEFWQTPNSHLAGQGNPKRSNYRPLNTETFIEKCKKFNNGDDYSKVVYINSRTKVCIIRAKGEIWVNPKDYLYNNNKKWQK